MLNKKWIGIVVFCLVCEVDLHAQQATPAPDTSKETSALAIGPPAHPATEDQVREYMALAGVAKSAHSVMDTSARAMQTTSAPYYPAAFWDDLRAEFLKLDVGKIYLPIYQRYFSQEEMQAVIDFYRSTPGKRLLELQPLLIRDAQDAMRKKGGEIGEAVYARHKDEIETAKAKYEAGQRATAPK